MPEALLLTSTLVMGLDLASGHHRARDISAGDLGQLVGIDGRARSQARHANPCQQHDQRYPRTKPNPESFTLS